MARPEWLVLQLADSAFPVGGFAHSGGLEAALQQGAAGATRAHLAELVDEVIVQAGHGALPFARAAFVEPARLGELDRGSDAFLVSHVAHRASRVQGRALLDACGRIFSRAEVAELQRQVAGERLRPHHAPLFGALARGLGLDEEACLAMYLHQAMRQVVSAAVRLGIVGPHEAQRVQQGAAPMLDRVLAECGALGVDDVAQTAPVLDLYQSTQDRLYSRLFQS